MADAEDLKSSGDFSSCGFDSHPGYQFFSPVFNQLTGSGLPRDRRVTPSLWRKSKNDGIFDMTA
jgi:hypothetical protein